METSWFSLISWFTLYYSVLYFLILHHIKEYCYQKFYLIIFHQNNLFIYIFIYLYIYLFIYLLVYLFIYLSVHLFICLFIYIFINLFLYLLFLTGAMIYYMYESGIGLRILNYLFSFFSRLERGKINWEVFRNEINFPFLCWLIWLFFNYFILI